MQNRSGYRFSCFLVLTVIFFCSCEKQGKYDLFPLGVGNEFYYSYYKYRYTGISAYTTGTEVWRIVSEYSNSASEDYLIERKFNGTLKVAGRTISYNDSISYFIASEKKSSSVISFMGFSFRRYNDEPQAELKRETLPSSSGMTWRAIFKTDSGMTYYNYYHPPNQITNEEYKLDSLKIIK